ncbi:winged helix-turn-helix transcriptional regulator [Mucilaginibacter sp. OK098]|uniref:winged helix-turn-helix transcriptional regulator n=1 Tax=Mucilaginibacter sp. OK098 TaxID=1855297 RepID=UPI00091852CF|nr:helix-turn-helix domain-containing protein [Mucilaginibacter sp. OK098]SHM03600.1 transcriptional regulator, HxlR family [Mucilaginibacter sp. OK098]
MIETEIIGKKYEQACDCPITAAVNVIGGKWKPIIIWILMTGSRRFGELHKSIPGIALKVLSRHLKELEADGVITRKAYPEVPPRVEYTLTEKGRALNGIMDLLVGWSREYVMEAR